MNYDDKVIKLDNGREYIVVKQLEHKGLTYLYLVGRENEDDTLFMEVKDGKLLLINPELFKDEILPLFLEQTVDMDE